MSSLGPLRWDSHVLQRKLKKLGIAPPPPKGKSALADIMKPGKFYVPGADAASWQKYNALLESALNAAQSRWTAEAYAHNVMAAALDAAPESERLAKPHGHVAARPVIDNHGYLAAALLAADAVEKLVPASAKKLFAAFVELGRTVARHEELGDEAEALLDREVPYVTLPSRAVSRQFTATGALRVAQGVALEAVEADIHNVGGKGAREACAEAVRLLPKKRAFLEKLDALILREDARLQFQKVAVKPSRPVVAARWRGAEKGKGSHWIAELEGGTLALLWKVKGKWRLVEGSRDDVLACVSDSHLRAATEALFDRRSSERR